MNRANTELPDETGRRPWRRKSRNFFLKSRMQSRFVLGFICVVAGGFILYLLLSYYLIDRHLAEELYRTHPRSRIAINASGSVMWWPAATAISAIISVSAVLVYYMTHRAESHLHGFIGAVRRAGQGDLTGRITLNKAHDGLCESFNGAFLSLDKRLSSIKRSCVALEDAVAQLGEATGGQLQRDAAQAALADIAVERVRVVEEIKRFRV